MLKFEMVGDSEMRAALAGCSKKIDDEIKSSMAFVVLRLQKQVKTHKLLGQVLNRRTGNLRDNIVRDSWQDGSLTVGVVGIASGAPYGKLHEYGFSGAVSVPAHVRQVKQAFGRRLKTPINVHVSAHTRRVRLPERSFMRTAFADMLPFIRQEFEAAAKRGLRW